MRITLRQGTAAEAAANNSVLSRGEPGYEHDTGKLKIGDGSTAWNSLAYFTPPDATKTTTTATTDYTAVLADAGNIVKMNVGVGNNFTIPTNASVAFPVGTEIVVYQYGAGTTTITAAGGVTLRALGGFVAMRAQYGVARVLKIDTDEWLVERSS